MNIRETGRMNVTKIKNTLRKRKVLSFIKSKKCDIVFVQETRLSPLDSQMLSVGWAGFVGAASGSSKSRGVTTLISKHLQFKCLKQSKDDAGRTLLLLSNVYAPNIDDPTFFGQLEKKIIDMGDYPVILGGDFNEVMDPVLDRSSKLVQVSRTHTALKGMSEACALIEVWWLQNPSGWDYTFFSSPHHSFSRIDFFLVSQSLISAAASSTIGNIILSDHSPVYLHMFAFNTTTRTPRWRLNSSLLLDETFKESLRSQINLYIETNVPSAPSAGVAWEALKAFLRGHIIQYASFKKRESLAKLQDLEQQIAITESSFKRNSSSANLNKLTKLKYEFNTIPSQKAAFSLFYVRQKYFEEGDKEGRLLARYIKQREALTTISAIKDDHGHLLFEPKRINTVFSNFYMDLYRPVLKFYATFKSSQNHSGSA
uniref:exodeoxyribonuclease III n=1 Tax=Cyprinodon variegatus TaxID=28743 RepID=A0A3Q2CN90_CYPVA